jgi:hypothetical protein
MPGLAKTAVPVAPVRQLAALVGSCAEQDAEQPKEELTEVDLEIMQGVLKRLEGCLKGENGGN